MDIVSWNIQFGRGCDGVNDLARIVRVARELADADVFCFQEVAANHPTLDDGQGNDQPAILASLLPGHHVIFRPAVDTFAASGARRQFGNAIASRYPVLQVFSHLLPRPPEVGVKSMQRQALEVVVAAPSGPLRVISTHLEFFSVGHRLAQIERIRALHRETAARVGLAGPGEGPYEPVPRPASLVLCGDFNLEPDFPEYPAMGLPFGDATPDLVDAWRVAHPGVPHAPTCGIGDADQWPGGPNCRDFFYVSADLAPRVAGMRVDVETTASDHQPVLLRLAD